MNPKIPTFCGLLTEINLYEVEYMYVLFQYVYSYLNMMIFFISKGMHIACVPFWLINTILFTAMQCRSNNITIMSPRKICLCSVTLITNCKEQFKSLHENIFSSSNLSFSSYYYYCNYSVPGKFKRQVRHVSLTFESSMKLEFEMDYKLEYHYYYEMMMMGLGLVALTILCSE